MCEQMAVGIVVVLFPPAFNKFTSEQTANLMVEGYAATYLKHVQMCKCDYKEAHGCVVNELPVQTFE